MPTGGYLSLIRKAHNFEASQIFTFQEMGYCVFQPESRVRRIWEFQGNKIPEKGSPLRKEYMEQLTQLGYGNMTDQVAITTQAKEKWVF